MNIKLRESDRFRLSVDHDNDNFIDINHVGYEALAVDFYLHFQYIEIRRKKDQIRVFSFKKKSHKKECDFGWWKDADVIMAINEQTINK